MVPAEPAPGPGQVVCARQHQPAAKWAAAGPVQCRFTRAGIPAELLPEEPACGCQGAHGRPGRLGIARGRSAAGRPGAPAERPAVAGRSEEHTSELQSPCNLVGPLLLEKTTPGWRSSGCAKCGFHGCTTTACRRGT